MGVWLAKDGRHVNVYLWFKLSFGKVKNNRICICCFACFSRSLDRMLCSYESPRATPGDFIAKGYTDKYVEPDATHLTTTHLATQGGCNESQQNHLHEIPLLGTPHRDNAS